MKKAYYSLLTCILFFGAALFAEESARAKHVFVVSIDQGNPAQIEELDLPFLHNMIKFGAKAKEAYTIVPSITLPSHTSMLTGVGIQKHQIDWNNYNREKGNVQVPTVFMLAKEKGLTTAMVVGKQKFLHISEAGGVDQFIWPPKENRAPGIADEFVNNIIGKKPNLCFIHFRDPDSDGHRYGVYSDEKKAAFKAVDTALDKIYKAIVEAGIWDDSVIIVSADHGSHDTKDKNGKVRGTHGSSRPDDVLIPWITVGKGVKKGYEITRPVLQVDTAATALWLLGVPIPEGMWGHPVTTAYEDN